jgi:hypothetical protein
MRRYLLTLVLFLPVAPLGGCFEFDEPVCSFACGPGGGADSCPEDYECRSDGYCHRQGTTEICPFTDASVIDQAAPVPDLTNPDIGPVDSGTD